jgi:membrane-associated phospholipid phosphatase
MNDWPLLKSAFSNRFLKQLVWTLLIFLSLLLYHFTNQRIDNTLNLKLPFDNAIPFLSFFVIPYLLYLPFVLACLITAVYRLDSKGIQFLFLFLASQIFANLCFYFFQTSVARPNVDNYNIFDQLVNLVYSNDKPVNTFPSLHVINSILCGYYMVSNKNKLWIFGFVFMVILSTVFMKQHYILDLIGGITWCVILYFVLNYLTKNKNQ